MTDMKHSVLVPLMFAVVCTVCLLGGCRGTQEEVVLEQLSLDIEEALLKDIDAQGQRSKTVSIPPSFVGGVLCVAGPHSFSKNDTVLVGLVGGAAVKEMVDISGFHDTRYLFHIDSRGGVVGVAIDWPVFIGAHYEVSVAGGKALTVNLDGRALTGIGLE